MSHWAEIWYDSLYPGITLRFYAAGQVLKYEFAVAPEVDPAIIQLDVGQSVLGDRIVTSDVVRCTSRTTPNLLLWEDRSPFAFQVGNPSIAVTFRAIYDTIRRYGFTIGEYDQTSTLVIDTLILD